MALFNGPFAPAGNGVTVQLPVSNVSSFIQFDNIMPGAGGFRKSGVVRLVNAGSTLVFVELCGSAGTVATAGAGVPILPGSERVLLSGGATAVAAVTAAGTSTLYATPGEGGV